MLDYNSKRYVGIVLPSCYQKVGRSIVSNDEPTFSTLSSCFKYDCSHEAKQSSARKPCDIYASHRTGIVVSDGIDIDPTVHKSTFPLKDQGDCVLYCKSTLFEMLSKINLKSSASTPCRFCPYFHLVRKG